jgi:anti-anti-sigma factor
MRVERQDVDGVAVLTVLGRGEIDLSVAEKFRAALLEAAGTADRVVLDCALVEFFDSAGMAALLTLQRDVVGRRKGRLALSGVNRGIQDIFRMVGFDSVLVLYADVPSAVSAVRG